MKKETLYPIWRETESCRGIFLPAWEEVGVKNLFTSRVGGVSGGPYASLNLGLHVADDTETVCRNRKILADAMKISVEEMVCCQQVHGSRVARVAAADRGRGAAALETAIADTDALITNEEDVYLTLFFADCVPLFFFDPQVRAIGLAHGGWKGAWGQIAAAVIHAMTDSFGSRVQDIQCWIGPGIDVCCFEIGDDLAEKVASREGWSRFLSRRENGRITWNLKQTHRHILLGNGILPEHIAVSGECTCCCEQDFFSYRRDHGITGRMAAVLGLKQRKK